MPPISTVPEPIRLLHLTDLHLFADGDSELRGANTDTTLNNVLHHYGRSGWQADLSLVTGDLIQDDSLAAYARCAAYLETLPAPVQLCPGNHDVPDLMDTAFSREPFTIGGRIDVGDWRIVALSTYIEGSAAGRLDETELRHCRQACETDRHVLIALHHPPVALGSRWLDALNLENADALMEIATNAHSARGIVFGHAHQAYDDTVDGLRLLCTPSTCRQFRPHSDRFAVDNEPPAYRRIELHHDGHITTEVIPVETD